MRMVDVFNPTEEDIIPINFIHALSLINRFTGASPWPISVLHHSIKIVETISNFYAGCMENKVEMMKAAFIHDWSEALFNDLASPVKKNFAGYKMHEERAQKVIFKAMGVDLIWLHAIDHYDKQIYRDEVHSTWGKIEDTYDTERKGFGTEYVETPWRETRALGVDLFGILFPDKHIGVDIL